MAVRMSEEDRPEEFKRAPLCLRITPSQQKTFDVLRRKLHLTRTGLVEAALETFCQLHDMPWPRAGRRRP